MIELSCDLGEAETPDATAVERQIWLSIDAANVACGGHAGDARSMREAAETARRRGVTLGAHPSYPDRKNFGRTSMVIGSTDLIDSLVAQIFSLRTIAAEQGVALKRVKAHGALYNDAHADRDRADAIVQAVRRVDAGIAVVASETSQTAAAAREAGLGVIREAFADRRYQRDGSLVPRRDTGALLTVTEAAEQARVLAEEGEVIARDGGRVPIAFETICIHADMAGAVDRLRAIRSALGR